ncbi:MAG TPA: hypothetical protein VF543_22405 [Pyrinomonadaceae bacterium]|jgi:hypothetical protein
MDLSFEKKVKLIENAAIKVVDEAMSYVRTVIAYGGELGNLNSAQGRENLKDVLKRGGINFPAVIVAYAGGVPRFDSMPLEIDKPIDIRHAFTLILVACDDNSRGTDVQRRGVETENNEGSSGGTYKMVSDFYDLFTARQLIARIDDEDVILNEGELIPLQDGFIERVPSITAQVVPFNGTFSFTTSGRDSNPPIQIEEIHFGLDVRNGPHTETDAPGVHENQED